MDNITTEILIIILIILFLLSAFFSGSETALMSINKYKMRHQAKLNNKGAIAAKKLLENPSKIIGVILLGNNLINIIIIQIATLIALRVYGNIGLAISTALLTVLILIFAELTPKTIGAIYSEKIGYFSALIYKPILIILYPLVFIINIVSNSFIRIIGLKNTKLKTSLSIDELKTVLKESSLIVQKPHMEMLESIIDLEKSTVEDIMIPRSDIFGIDISDDIEVIIDNFKNTPYTRIPVYNNDLENLLGLIHIKNIAPFLSNKYFNKNEIYKLIREPHFIVSGTNLYKQLLDFKKEKKRIGFIIDEYGEIQGLVTLEDILEEIVGDFTSNPNLIEEIISTKDKNIFIVDGGLHIREINQALKINLISEEAKTINGFILEHTENIPKVNDTITIQGHIFKILENHDNTVKTTQIEIKNENI